MNNKQLAHTLIDLDLTQAQLAEKLGVTPNTITVWKRSERFPKWLKLALETLKSQSK